MFHYARLLEKCSDVSIIFLVLLVSTWSCTSSAPQQQEPGLLFYLSGNKGFRAHYSAGGKPEPNYLHNVKIIPDGAKGSGSRMGSWRKPLSTHSQLNSIRKRHAGMCLKD